MALVQLTVDYNIEDTTTMADDIYALKVAWSNVLDIPGVDMVAEVCARVTDDAGMDDPGMVLLEVRLYQNRVLMTL